MEKKEIEQIARRAKEGFTLIEIMVVVGILGLLMAVLIPNVTGKMDEARIASARVQLKNVEEALVGYQMKHGGKYPDTLEVLVDNKPAVQNVTRFANHAGYAVEVKELEDDEFSLTLHKA